MMLPEITQLEFRPEQTEDLPKIKKFFLYDFKKKDFVVKDGRLIVIEGIEAIKQWIEKVLRTEKFKFKIYEDIDYGISVEDLIGYEYPQQFIDAEIKREVTESLLKHPNIKNLSEWNIVKDNPILNISFKVDLIDGESFSQEVSF